MSEQERKAATRHKIQLGGLVHKAGLCDVEIEVLLGAFIAIADQLQSDPQAISRYREVGAEQLALSGKAT